MWLRGGRENTEFPLPDPSLCLSENGMGRRVTDEGNLQRTFEKLEEKEC
jgi:hypothetical protein